VLIAVLAGGGFLVIVIVAVILVATGVFSSGSNGSGGDSPTERLSAAAQRLTGQRAIGLHGTISASSDKLEGDVKITRGGWVTGDVTWGGQNVQLIASDDTVFVKGGWDFWRTEGDISDKADWITNQRWGKLAYSSVGSSLKREMTPSAIATDMRGVSRYSVTSTEQAAVQGTPALKIITSSSRYYVSTGDSPRLLRIETDYPQTAVDVTELTGSVDPVTELRTRVNQLSSSFDPSRNTRVDKISWGSCTASGCTVHSKVWSTRGSDPSVRVTVFVRISANNKNGRKLGECSNSGTVTSYESINVTCRVTSASWRSFRSGSGYRRWWGHSEAMAGGATAAQVQTLLTSLNSE
jgi:hypothetical protein